MAFPTSKTHRLLAVEWTDALRRAVGIRADALTRMSEMSAGAVTSERLISTAEIAQLGITYMQDKASVPGIAAYGAANITPSMTTQELSDAFNAMLSALQAVVDNVTNTFPPNGYLENPPLVNGNRSLKTYNSAQTAALQALLQAVADTIEPFGGGA